MDEELRIYHNLSLVKDPEIPVLSILDLGIVRALRVLVPGSELEMDITPTYSGCPAVDVIKKDIRLQMAALGYKTTTIKTVLSPAWTSDWITEEGRDKLAAYGIAPPGRVSATRAHTLFALPEAVECPQCRSQHTEMISEFGSTSCKSLHRCLQCGEPFDHFKCH